MKVTASGPPGSGKSSVCRLLCERFGFELLSAGEAFRALAEYRGITLEDLGQLAEKGPEIDAELDRRMVELLIHVQELRKCHFQEYVGK